MRARGGIAVAVAAVAAATLWAGAASAAAPLKRLTDTDGQVTATVTFRKASFSFARNVALTVARSGTVVLSEKLLDAEGKPDASLPTGATVTDLDGDGEPEVLVDQFSGGAHCCEYTRIYRFDGTTYSSVVVDWGNYGHSLEDLDGDGVPELRTSDDRFAYTFTAYVASVPPIRILRYQAGVLSDVTRSFPALVRRDLRANWKLLQRIAKQRDDIRGVAAAWLADKYLLGEEKAGWTTLRDLRKRGLLRGFPPWPSGFAYLRELRAFLEQAGYAA
ncbi:MAG: VCBS repeat-containing protein [Thermoleophilia bacterium]